MWNFSLASFPQKDIPRIQKNKKIKKKRKCCWNSRHQRQLQWLAECWCQVCGPPWWWPCTHLAWIQASLDCVQHTLWRRPEPPSLECRCPGPSLGSEGKTSQSQLTHTSQTQYIPVRHSMHKSDTIHTSQTQYTQVKQCMQVRHNAYQTQYAQVRHNTYQSDTIQLGTIHTSQTNKNTSQTQHLPVRHNTHKSYTLQTSQTQYTQVKHNTYK